MIMLMEDDEDNNDDDDNDDDFDSIIDDDDNFIGLNTHYHKYKRDANNDDHSYVVIMMIAFAI